MTTLAAKEMEMAMDEVHDPRDDERPYVEWAPLYVPVLAAALVVFMIVILGLA